MVSVGILVFSSFALFGLEIEISVIVARTMRILDVAAKVLS